MSSTCKYNLKYYHVILKSIHLILEGFTFSSYQYMDIWRLLGLLMHEIRLKGGHRNRYRTSLTTSHDHKQQQPQLPAIWLLRSPENHIISYSCLILLGFLISISRIWFLSSTRSQNRAPNETRSRPFFFPQLDLWFTLFLFRFWFLEAVLRIPHAVHTHRRRTPHALPPNTTDSGSDRRRSAHQHRSTLLWRFPLLLLASNLLLLEI